MTAHASVPETTATVAFEWTVRAAIVINTTVLIWSFLDTAHEEALEPIHSALLLFFLGELLYRLHHRGWNVRKFFTGEGGRWNLFDTVIVTLSLLPLFVSGLDTTLLRTARLARLTHSVRHVSHVSHVRFATLLPRGLALRMARLKKQVTSVD